MHPKRVIDAVDDANGQGNTCAMCEQSSSIGVHAQLHMRCLGFCGTMKLCLSGFMAVRLKGGERRWKGFPERSLWIEQRPPLQGQDLGTLTGRMHIMLHVWEAHTVCHC